MAAACVVVYEYGMPFISIFRTFAKNTPVLQFDKEVWRKRNDPREGGAEMRMPQRRNRKSLVNKAKDLGDTGEGVSFLNR